MVIILIQKKTILESIITVMAVDNLPCELPKDASSFGQFVNRHNAKFDR